MIGQNSLVKFFWESSPGIDPAISVMGRYDVTQLGIDKSVNKKRAIECFCFQSNSFPKYYFYCMSDSGPSKYCCMATKMLDVVVWQQKCPYSTRLENVVYK